MAIRIGGSIKQRLLTGALQINLEQIREQGAGQLLGRVIESQALESLALNGGLGVLVAGVELVMAAWVLALGAGGYLHVILLFGWLGVAMWLSWRYFVRLRSWTLSRLAMTHDLVERMVGHRTRLAQEPAERGHDSEDDALQSYVRIAGAMDRASTVVSGVIPRGWLLLGLGGLIPNFVAGSATPVGLAISLGGILLAHRALESMSSGLTALARAATAWKQIAPLFHAAGKDDLSQASYLPAVHAKRERTTDSPEPVIEAHNLVFQYPASAEPVLAHCSLTIHQGERLLLEGPSGGGKSTLAVLLVGLRQPQSGLLLLNGLDRPTLGLEWRRRSSAAPQFHENHILMGTLAFNLLMARHWPPDEAELEEAEVLCRELGLDGLLERMPSGIMQMVGETGWQLSHGERSRVYLARSCKTRTWSCLTRALRRLIRAPCGSAWSARYTERQR